MPDLHDLLRRESERYTLPAGAADRMFERGSRRARNRRIATIGVSSVLFLVVLAILRAGLPGGHWEQRPAVLTRRSIAGTYVVRLSTQEPGVGLAHMGGQYKMRLSANGDLELISPRGFDLPGDSIMFDIDDGVLTTDALVGSECETPGTCRVSLDADLLTLTPIEESCELRRIVCASQPWTAAAGAGHRSARGRVDRFVPVRRMVRAVRRAPVPAEIEAFWRAAVTHQYSQGPTQPVDLSDPCRFVPEPLVYVFRFTDGRLQIFDAPELEEGFDGRYVVRGDTITISDASDRNIAGRYQAAFRVHGDRVTFDLLGRAASDAFFGATLESALFTRTA